MTYIDLRTHDIFGNPKEPEKSKDSYWMLRNIYRQAMESDNEDVARVAYKGAVTSGLSCPHFVKNFPIEDPDLWAELNEAKKEIRKLKEGKA